MDNNLTIDSLVFAEVYRDKTGSLRRNTSAGVNLPKTMQVKHQAYKDSFTKRDGTQSALIFAKTKALSDGTIAEVVRVTVKVQSLKDEEVVAADVTETIQLAISTLQEDDSGLDLMDEIFVNQEQ